MRRQVHVILAVSFSLCLCGAGAYFINRGFHVDAASALRQAQAAWQETVKRQPPLVDPHHHVGEINNNSLGPQNAAEFKMMPASVESNLVRENLALNQAETFQAFPTCEPACRVLVENLETRQVFELQAPSFAPSRPFSDFVWITDSLLAFDQWSQPHYGVHYVVNVTDRQLILASPFTDQLP